MAIGVTDLGDDAWRSNLSVMKQRHHQIGRLQRRYRNVPLSDGRLCQQAAIPALRQCGEQSASLLLLKQPERLAKRLKHLLAYPAYLLAKAKPVCCLHELLVLQPLSKPRKGNIAGLGQAFTQSYRAVAARLPARKTVLAYSPLQWNISSSSASPASSAAASVTSLNTEPGAIA